MYLEGRITYRSFIGKDGQQRTIAEIVMDDFIVFGDGKRPIPGETVANGTRLLLQPSRATEEVTPVVAPSESKQDETVNPEDIPF